MKEQLQAAKQNTDDTADTVDDDMGSKEVDVMMSYVPCGSENSQLVFRGGVF